MVRNEDWESSFSKEKYTFPSGEDGSGVREVSWIPAVDEDGWKAVPGCPVLFVEVFRWCWYRHTPSTRRRTTTTAIVIYFKGDDFLSIEITPCMLSAFDPCIILYYNVIWQAGQKISEK